MNTTDPTNAQFAAYRAMWSYFNAVLFGGSLDHVILNFSRLARSLGFFAPGRWRDSADNVTHEISLNPAHLRHDNAKDAASTLVHEMVHAWRHGARAHAVRYGGAGWGAARLQDEPLHHRGRRL
jgi:hypothetical protein